MLMIVPIAHGKVLRLCRSQDVNEAKLVTNMDVNVPSIMVRWQHKPRSTSNQEVYIDHIVALKVYELVLTYI